MIEFKPQTRPIKASAHKCIDEKHKCPHKADEQFSNGMHSMGDRWKLYQSNNGWWNGYLPQVIYLSKCPHIQFWIFNLEMILNFFEKSSLNFVPQLFLFHVIPNGLLSKYYAYFGKS